MRCWKIRHLVSGNDYLLTAETEEQLKDVWEWQKLHEVYYIVDKTDNDLPPVHEARVTLSRV